MPTIDASLSELSTLARAKLTVSELDKHLALVKGELKRGSGDEDLRIELQDTNRPDLWCVEGIARQIRFALERSRDWRQDHAFLERPGALAGRIEVDRSVEKVRPFVAAFLARGFAVDDAGLRAFIQAQETLSRNFGRKRATLAIGIYDGKSVKLPVRYEAVPLDDTSRAFVPLSPTDLPHDVPAERWSKPWTPAEILRDHPTGREFRGALPGDLAPILVDASGAVLSFPPIINSASLGRVVPGMDELFVEVTGTALDQVLLAANILAANLHDRGGEILPIATRYPYDTPRGRELIAPHPLPDKRMLALPLERFRALLGEPGLSVREVSDTLLAYGLEVHAEEGDYLRVVAPPYRQDYLHEVDAVEDFAIARGYQTFAPRMPEEFTVGRLASSTDYIDRVRDLMIGYGFEEAISNILTEERLLREVMLLDDRHPGLPPLHGGPLVRIANVMNASYACLRDWLLPSLLEIESHSSGAAYPHRIFEAGEVAVADPAAAHRSRSEHRVAGLVAHERASFTEAQAYLNLLLFHLGIRDEGKRSYQLVPAEHPSFIAGRFARVVCQDECVGLLGELHPAVLAGERGFGIRLPCAGFELSISSLMRPKMSIQAF